MVNLAGLILAGIIIVAGFVTKIMVDMIDWCAQRQVGYQAI
jgi:hypothetical protein